MAKAKSRPQRARLSIDFPNREALARFYSDLKSGRLLPQDSEVYAIDALDLLKCNGVTLKNTYIVRRKGSRPNPLTVTRTA